MKMLKTQFNKDRKYLKDTITYNDPEGKYVSSVPLKEPIFIKENSNYFQLLGINSSYVDGKYVEIFISVDIANTMKFFDGRAVKTFYFNDETIKTVVEVEENEAKKGYQRAEWRRLQKYLKKEKVNIVKNTQKDEKGNY